MRQWTDQQTYKKSEIILKQCTKIPEIYPENLEKIYHPGQNISKDNLISVRNWDNEKTDRHTRNISFIIQNLF